MNSLKTGLVVVVLLAAGYGVYVMLYKAPGSGLPEELTRNPWNSAPVEFSTEGDPAWADAGGQPPLDDGSHASHADGHPDVQLGNASDPHGIGEQGEQQVTYTTPEAFTSDSSSTVASDPSLYASGLPDDPTMPADALSAATPDPLAHPITNPALATGPDSAAGAHPSLGMLGFTTAWHTAESHLARNELGEALDTLSIWYNSPDLTSEQRNRLTALLDQLAGTVIYSNEHHLEPAYVVRGRETLTEIAERYDVNPQLLANINGIADPDTLVPGQDIKVLRGPFRAEVDMSSGEMTLFLNRYYAGRFPVSMGTSPAPQAGTYQVVQKKHRRQDFYFANGRRIAANDPANPYGAHWMGLSGGLAIHGSPEANYVSDAPGCLGLSPIDAADVFAIMSEQDSVIIKQSSAPSETATSATSATPPASGGSVYR
jgi:lipoprotein-anchoring transpeptidase ErfK/SrfK